MPEGRLTQGTEDPAPPVRQCRPLEGAEGCGSKPACAGLDSPKSQRL